MELTPQTTSSIPFVKPYRPCWKQVRRTTSSYIPLFNTVLSFSFSQDTLIIQQEYQDTHLISILIPSNFYLNNIIPQSWKQSKLLCRSNTPPLCLHTDVHSSGGKSQENVADQTTGTTHGSALTGEGSHLGQSTHTGTGTTGQHNSSVLGSDSKTSPLTGNHSSGVGSTQSSGLTGEGTHFSTGHNQGLTGHNTTQSGLTNTEGAQLGHATGHNHGLTSGTTHPSGVTGSHNTTTGPHTHDISNRADPRVDSDNSKIGHSGLTGDHTSSGSGIGSNQHSGLPGTHHGSSTHDSSILPGHSTTGPHQTEAANRLDPNVSSGNSKIENAAHHHSEKRGGGAEEADQHHSSSGVGSTGFGSSGTGHSTTTAGPHDSNLLNKAGKTFIPEMDTKENTNRLSDPRIDSDRSKQSGIGHSTTSHHDNNDSHLGRDAALGAGAVGAAGQ